MIPKAELQKRVEEQERKLQLIYRYKPSLEYIEENVPVLESLGLRDYQIEEVIAKGHTHISTSITNPLTGEEMAIYVEEVSIRKGDDGTYGVFIGDAPYREFFSKAQLTKARLDELCETAPEVRELFKENQQMRTLLALLGKKE